VANIARDVYITSHAKNCHTLKAKGHKHTDLPKERSWPNLLFWKTRREVAKIGDNYQLIIGFFLYRSDDLPVAKPNQQC